MEKRKTAAGLGAVPADGGRNSGGPHGSVVLYRPCHPQKAETGKAQKKKAEKAQTVKIT